MKEDKKQVEFCIRWIAEFTTKTNEINKSISSYGYKHLVENWCGEYISNDSFKLAARSSGLMIEPLAEIENELYNLSIIDKSR